MGEPGSAEAEQGAGRKCRLANYADRCCVEASGRAQAGLSRLAQSSGRGDGRFAPKAVGLDSAKELLRSPGAGEPKPERSAWPAALQAAVLGRSVTEIPGLATEGFGAQGRGRALPSGERYSDRPTDSPFGASAGFSPAHVEKPTLRQEISRRRRRRSHDHNPKSLLSRWFCLSPRASLGGQARCQPQITAEELVRPSSSPEIALQRKDTHVPAAQGGRRSPFWTGSANRRPGRNAKVAVSQRERGGGGSDRKLGEGHGVSQMRRSGVWKPKIRKGIPAISVPASEGTMPASFGHRAQCKSCTLKYWQWQTKVLWLKTLPRSFQNRMPSFQFFLRDKYSQPRS